MPPIQMWRYQTPAGVAAVAISPGGTHIVAGTLAKTVLSLDATGALGWQVETGNQAWRIGQSDDGETIVVGTGSTRFWDMGGRGLYCFARDGTLRWQKDLAASVWGLALSADGDTIAAGTSNKQVLVFDGAGNMLWQQDVPGRGWYAWVWSTAVSADGHRVAAGAADKRIRLLERSGRVVKEHQTRGDVFTVTMAADGSLVAAGDNQGYIYLLDGNGRLLWEEQLNDKVWRVQLDTGGSKLLVGAGEKEAHLRVYDPAGRLLWRRFVNDAVSCLAFSADAQRIATGTYGGKIFVFDNAGNILHTARAQKNIRDIALSYSGETVVAGSGDGYVYGFHLPPAEEPPTETTDSGHPIISDSPKPDSTPAPVPTPPAQPVQTFGEQLRYCRRQASNPTRGGSLTQQDLADFLDDEGFIVSHVTISNWERNITRIPHTDRPLLVAIIRILHQYHGIPNHSAADQLLFAGGYRRLDREELHQTGLV